MSWHSIKLVHRNGVEPFPLAFRGPRSALAADLLQKTIIIMVCYYAKREIDLTISGVSHHCTKTTTTANSYIIARTGRFWLRRFDLQNLLKCGFDFDKPWLTCHRYLQITAKSFEPDAYLHCIPNTYGNRSTHYKMAASKPTYQDYFIALQRGHYTTIHGLWQLFFQKNHLFS